MRLLDSHCHLDDPKFDADRDEVIARARAAGVATMLAVGTGSGPPDLEAGLRIAERYPFVYATVGVHPHDASKASEETFSRLRELAAGEKVAAVGEIGLDYHYDNSPRDIQKLVLIRQMELARGARLPIIIHCREAWPDLTEITQAHWNSSGLGGILHCFSGSRQDAMKFLGWGFQVSFAGKVTYKKAEDLREVAREIPLDRLLIETDCPYLAPVPYRGKRNEPAFVIEVARTLAALHHLSPEELGEIVVRNFERLFGLNSEPPIDTDKR